MRYRKIAVEISAVQWSGDDECLTSVLDWTKGYFMPVDDGVYTAAVYDRLHDTWVKLRTGDYVLQGLDGEFYPCEKSVFERSYESL